MTYIWESHTNNLITRAVCSWSEFSQKMVSFVFRRWHLSISLLATCLDVKEISKCSCSILITSKPKITCLFHPITCFHIFTPNLSRVFDSSLQCIYLYSWTFFLSFNNSLMSIAYLFNFMDRYRSKGIAHSVQWQDRCINRWFQHILVWITMKQENQWVKGT